ncbi:MAG: hypothetical protein ABI823_18590, partial [Bryobacteraceae bacterium]
EDVQAIEGFIRACREPAFIEPGEDPIPLASGAFAIDRTSRGTYLQCWSERKSFNRRVLSVEHESRGKLHLVTERFGKRVGTAWIADLAIRADAVREGRRLKFREQFRRFLSRQFTGWTIAEISTGADLEHSLSPAYTRAMLTRGSSVAAAIGAPLDSKDPHGALTFGLIWLDYLRKRMPERYIETLTILVPSGMERVTCDRVRHLRGVQFQVFAHGDEGGECLLDLADYGNFTTRVEPCRSMTPYPSWLAPVLQVPGVEAIARPDGGLSIRVRGLEFVHISSGSALSPNESPIRFGIDRRKPASERNANEVLSLARHLAAARNAGSPRTSPLFRRYPEAWLESQVRASIDEIDAELAPSPVYGQVPAFAAAERGLIDLLAADRYGRLAVIELKASADIHLPLQALDYWMRVKWHLERGEFARSGHFPGLPLRSDPPKLYLLAPALEFHPANETVLRYFASGIQVERVGLSLEWRQRLKVASRSAESAGSQSRNYTQHGFWRSQGNPARDLESESG